MDNVFRERLWRSVKHEDVCLKDHTAMKEVKAGLEECSRRKTDHGFTKQGPHKQTIHIRRRY